MSLKKGGLFPFEQVNGFRAGFQNFCDIIDTNLLELKTLKDSGLESRNALLRDVLALFNAKETELIELRNEVYLASKSCQYFEVSHVRFIEERLSEWRVEMDVIAGKILLAAGSLYNTETKRHLLEVLMNRGCWWKLEAVWMRMSGSPSDSARNLSSLKIALQKGAAHFDQILSGVKCIKCKEYYTYTCAEDDYCKNCFVFIDSCAFCRDENVLGTRYFVTGNPVSKCISCCFAKRRKGVEKSIWCKTFY